MDTPRSAALAAPEQDDPTSWRVDDVLWAKLKPILPSDERRRKPGRPRRDDRAIVDGLIWPARAGGEWGRLRRAFGPTATVHERFRGWVETGKPERARAVLWRADGDPLGLDWTRQAADGGLGEAPFGTKGAPARRGRPAAPPPTAANRGPTATPDEGKRIPVTGAHRTDTKQRADLPDATVDGPAPAGPPQLVLARGAAAAGRAEAAARGDAVPIPPGAGAATPPPGHPGRHPPRPWVVEVGHGRCNRVRRLLVRWEHRGDHDRGFVQLAAVLISSRKVRDARPLSG